MHFWLAVRPDAWTHGSWRGLARGDELAVVDDRVGADRLGLLGAQRCRTGPWPGTEGVNGKMGAMMVSIDRAGRVVIPKGVRDRLGLDAGVELVLEVEGDTIRLERHRAAQRALDWVDGRPVLRAVPGRPLTDADVQALRDADQR